MANMKNIDIRNHAMANGVKLWEVADALGVTDFTFSRKLRHELPEEEKARIMTIIDQIKEEGR